MTGTQASNVRITRARAAKSTLNNALPPLPPAQGKPRGKRAATESNISGSSVAAEPLKRRAVLSDVSNICKEAAAVDCLKKPKAVKVVSQNANAKGRGRGIPRNNKKITQEAEIKKETSPAICNVDDASAGNAIGDDKQNNNVNTLKEVQDNPKELNPIAEQISVHPHCKQSVEKPNEKEIVVSDNKAAVASLKQQSTLQSLRIPKQPKSSLKQVLHDLNLLKIKTGNPVPLAKLHEDVGRSSCSDFIDIDSEYKDPQMCTAYVTDIYENMRVVELKRRPLPNFMETTQRDINANMRSVLIDWLVEVSEEYKLVPDTLYLTVSYIDRFLSANVVNRQRLQLLGVSCMLVASKYEEICAPPVEEFCYITDNTYKKEEVLEMEISVLNRLQYDLTTPTTKTFLRRFIRAAQASCKVSSLHLEFMGNYLAELTLVEYDFLKYLPSLIAAAAVFVARMTLDPMVHPWNSTLQHYTGYKVSDMRDCICAIHDLQLNRKGCTLAAIREKYNQPKFKCVANLFPPPVISPQFLIDNEV